MHPLPSSDPDYMRVCSTVTTQATEGFLETLQVFGGRPDLGSVGSTGPAASFDIWNRVLGANSTLREALEHVEKRNPSQNIWTKKRRKSLVDEE